MTSPRLLVLVTMVTAMMKASAAAPQSRCSNTTILRTQTACHPCSITMTMACPPRFTRTPQSGSQDCYFQGPGAGVLLPGCSFQCFREQTVQTCCPGFWGPDCLACPEQAGRPCGGRGACSDGPGGDGTCTCQAGFAGTSCEDCAPGRFGSTCSSVCSCVHGVCDSGLKGDGRCSCLSGFSGPRCDQELPSCVSLRCPPPSVCVKEPLTGRLQCRCLPGYKMEGAQCALIDPCLQKVCHPNATCILTGPNQHICICNYGYHGDGRVCVAVDPCQNRQGGCSARHSRCVYDGPGKSHCECPPGLEVQPDGGCGARNACRPGSCHPEASCSTLGPQTVQCTCRQGFVGNGQVCYGNIFQRLEQLNTEPGGRWRNQLTSAITLFGSISWPLRNLGPFTLFVPVNKGFRGAALGPLMADKSKAQYLCKMHLVAGVTPFDTLKKSDVFYMLTGKPAEAETDALEGNPLTVIRIHGSRRKGLILQSDLAASNGMIHIISRLMESVDPTVDSDPQENLMKIISDYGKFDQFRSLLESSGVASVLDRPGPLTLFAPVDLAFRSMSVEELQYLRSTEGARKLLELLRNHVVPSVALDVFNMVSAPRLVSSANQVLAINVTEKGQLMVGGAGVLEAAVEARNGRLYVVDGVLTPPSILPLLPHRCDVTQSRTVQGQCVSCSRVKLSGCSSGIFTGSSVFGCIYSESIGQSAFSLPKKGCSPICNATVTTPACCSGFYGPDCSVCPGGFQAPCSGRGQCLDGMEGNGTCVCPPNFRGSRCQFCTATDKFGPNCDRTCPCIHGRCDSRPDSDGRCRPDSCLPGFSGYFCERRTAACGAEAQFCHAYADCDYNRWGFRCVCRQGFQGDGITCAAEDPCAPPARGGCGVNARCVPQAAGAASCQCLPGWRPDADDCQPINSCQDPDRGGCHPNATCIYVGPGQSDCSCDRGFRGDGRSCEAENRCTTPTGGCHYLASCRLVASVWTCVCDEGFLGDGRTCYGTVLQEVMVLPEASEFFSWTKAAELSHLLSDKNVTLLLPSSEAVAKMSPEDREFWTATENLPGLVRNHLIQGVHPLEVLRNMTSVTSLLQNKLPVSTQQQLPAVGGGTIRTGDVMASNGLIHVVDQVLLPDRKLSSGLLATLRRRPEFSLFMSFLEDHRLMEELEQNQQFTVFAPTDDAVRHFLQESSAPALDVNVTRYHLVAGERLLRADLQAGGYRKTLLGFNFQLRFFSRDGKLYVNAARVNSSDVLAGGGVVHGLTKVLEVEQNRCDLVQIQRVTGSCLDCLFPRGNVCPSNSTPDALAKKTRCMFTRFFEGERLLTIGCRVTCLKTNIEPRCCAGFFSRHCEACPGPAARPCFGHGRCSDGLNGTGLCHCDSGFSGTACEGCRTGRYGVHCDQDCRCKNGRCSDGLHGDGTCDCDVGWRGVLCDRRTAPSAADACHPLSCHSSANCVSGPDGPRCLCAAGFQGNGTFCQAKDACAVANGGCSVSAVCKRTRRGQRVCVCNSGFTGDGLVCLEVNPCLEGNGGCHANADCIHIGPNRTSCGCRVGFGGDGRVCRVVDLCATGNGGCHQSAQCTMMGPGVVKCACTANFVGDGLTCKGTVAKEILLRRLRDFYFGLMVAEISLKGRGPFTVFVPGNNAYAMEKNSHNRMKMGSDTQKEAVAAVLRNHIVMCHTLLPEDLRQPRNLTSLSGLVLRTGISQGAIFVNQANVTYSDDVSVNGIFHEIDRILLPPHLEDLMEMGVARNLSEVATRGGYGTFYDLLKNAGVMELVQDGIHQPVTVFLPSDGVMASLPQEQRDFLFHRHNRPQLLEYLKYHILLNQKVYAEQLVYLGSARTLQGSALSFGCGGPDAIGEIFINDGECRVAHRHLVFGGGMAYGIDCLLAPPSLGGRCDRQTAFDIKTGCGVCGSNANRCPLGSKLKEVQSCDLPTMFVHRDAGCQSVCVFNLWRPKCCRGYYGRDCQACPGGEGSPCGGRGRCDDGHLGNGTCACDAGFGGAACELCQDGFYGPNCTACRCSGRGSCDQGRRGTGACLCEDGWTGPRCQTPRAEVPRCSPPCSPKAVCRESNTCVCRPFYQGDGLTCTVEDLCTTWNGGCARGAVCSQEGEKVTCSCPEGHAGDGFTCWPADPCGAGENGGCHEHAVCTVTAPGKRKCTCKDGFVGDGLACEVERPAVSRCLLDNGGCHADAACTDLHFEDATLGVFHVRADGGQYLLNYTAASQMCAAAGGRLATYDQLSSAQQGGLNMCAAGWLDRARVAYPTTYSNPNCGFGHVGIVDYGARKNLSETWDAFCYRMKEVSCVCRSGFLGDGFSCIGNLLHVLVSTPAFSGFLTQILNFSQTSDSGRSFVRRLSDPDAASTLFVPDNDGLDNQTLSQRDLELHLSEGRALPLRQLTNGTHLQTRVGSLTVLGVADLLRPSALASFYINGRFVTASDIPASNGIIHVLGGPLQAPPPPPQSHAASAGLGVILVVLLVVGFIFVGFHFYRRKAKPFQFQYFKDEAAPVRADSTVCNPGYEADPGPTEGDLTERGDDVTERRAAKGGSRDLLDG